MCDCQFYPGQKVRVVPKPVVCAYGWIETMNKWCDREVTILRVIPDYHFGSWFIKVAENDFSWDEDCFVAGDEPIVSAEEVNNLL